MMKSGVRLAEGRRAVRLLLFNFMVLEQGTAQMGITGGLGWKT